METLIKIALITLTIIGEARNQPIDGQKCVAWTIRNRMASTGLGVEETVFHREQYTLWEPDIMAPGYGLRMRWLMCATKGSFPTDPWCMEPMLIIGDASYWWKIWQIASSVYHGQEPPPPGCEDVVNYLNPALCYENGGLPSWTKEMELTVCYGDHCFWRSQQGTERSKDKLLR